VFIQKMKPLALLLLLAAGAFGADRPNVLFIIVDDLTTTLGSYGDKAARTPNMDALAARGVRFQRAYTQFALCNPSRCSFLTGCYPERTRVFDLTTSLRVALPDVVTLPQAFKDAGYLSGRIGKVFHVADPKTKLDTELPAPLGLDNALLREAKLAQESEGDLSDPVRTKGRKDAAYNKPFAASAHPDKDFTDHAIADRAMRTLEAWQGKPFFLAVGFIRPHTPFVAPKAFFDGIDRAKLPLPPFFQEGGENLSLIPQPALRPNNNLFALKQADKKEALDARHAYEASASWTDSQVGRLLAKLKELKLEENTIVVLTGDHGYQLGEHGLWAKQTLFEGSCHVPLIVAAPGVKPAVCQGLVEQVDIYPTLTGLAGLPTPSSVQGRSLQPLLADPNAPGKPAAFSTMVSSHTKLIGHSVRTDRFRYIEWDEGRAGRQLYDHQSDPDELHNLASNPNQADRLKRLQARLTAHLAAVSSAPPASK
jgi:iduronate 2-sulfatase